MQSTTGHNITGHATPHHRFPPRVSMPEQIGPHHYSTHHLSMSFQNSTQPHCVTPRHIPSPLDAKAFHRRPRHATPIHYSVSCHTTTNHPHQFTSAHCAPRCQYFPRHDLTRPHRITSPHFSMSYLCFCLKIYSRACV